MGGLISRPKPEPVAPMPDDNDPAVVAARRREIEEARQRGGRASTMLSDSYSSRNLGGQG